jgi:hypothetical protein
MAASQRNFSPSSDSNHRPRSNGIAPTRHDRHRVPSQSIDRDALSPPTMALPLNAPTISSCCDKVNGSWQSAFCWTFDFDGFLLPTSQRRVKSRQIDKFFRAQCLFGSMASCALVKACLTFFVEDHSRTTFRLLREGQGW